GHWRSNLVRQIRPTGPWLQATASPPHQSRLLPCSSLDSAGSCHAYAASTPWKESTVATPEAHWPAISVHGHSGRHPDSKSARPEQAWACQQRPATPATTELD